MPYTCRLVAGPGPKPVAWRDGLARARTSHVVAPRIT